MPLPVRSRDRSMALAKSALPSARKSTLSAFVAFFQASSTEASFTAVTAMVSTPLAFSAVAFCTMVGMCCLWQVPVKAPGTANSATFFPLKISSVVFHAGPSAVVTRNLALGSRSPTLMGMDIPFLCGWWWLQTYGNARRKLVEVARNFDGIIASGQGELDLSACDAGAGRHAFDVKGEAACSVRSTFH